MSMKNKIDAVKQFHEAFNIGFRTIPKADLGSHKNTLRFNLMKEENEEPQHMHEHNHLSSMICTSLPPFTYGPFQVAVGIGRITRRLCL